MPLSLRRGTVTAVTERHEELVRLEVDGERCIAYPRVTGPVEVGDDVIVNVQAGELALGWCRAEEADAVVCAIGPGIVGTETSLGHGGVVAAEAVNAAAALGGRAVLAPRVSGADPRERHRGLSHHTQAVLRLCLAEPL